MSDTVALIMGTSPVWAGLVAYILTELRPVLWFMLKGYCKNYFIVLQDKHNKFLADHPDVSGWETNDKETMVWVRSEVASVPRSLFGLPTTIILELASKEPYRGSGKEVVLKRNKHYFFQEMWYGFMDRMEKI